MSALASAAVQGGVSLIGGLMGNRAQEKAAHKQFLRQDALDEQSDRRHRDAVNEANGLQSQMYAWELGATAEINTAVTNWNERAFYANEAMRDYVPGVDFDRLVKEAEAVGLNPMTLVRAGMGAAYARTPPQQHAYMGYLAPGSAPQAIQPQRGNTGQAVAANPTNAWGDAVAAALAAYNAYDPYKGQRQATEFAIAEAQLENLKADTASTNRRLSVPTVFASNVVRSSGGFEGAMAAGRLGGSPTGLEEEDGKVTNLHTGFWQQAPWFADVASWAERHGEPAEWLAFPASVLADASYNAYRAVKHVGSSAGAAQRQANRDYLAETWSWITSSLDPTQGGRNKYQ